MKELEWWCGGIAEFDSGVDDDGIRRLADFRTSGIIENSEILMEMDEISVREMDEIWCE